MSDTGNLDRMIVERQNERVWENAMIRSVMHGIRYGEQELRLDTPRDAACDQTLSWSARRLTR